MTVFESLEKIDVPASCSVSIGTFDGVHIGHMAVLDVMLLKAKEMGLKSFVYTFQNNPSAYFKGNSETGGLITGKAEKLAILESMGVDYVALLPFDEVQVALSAEDFVKEILAARLGAKFVSVGHDFRFGHGAAHHASDLKEMGREYHFDVHIMTPILYNGIRISSTDIRMFLSEGKVEEAARLLGRNFFVIGTVVSGAAIGRKIGVPTINFSVTKDLSLRKGVYFTRCEFGGRILNSITNVGVKPTVTTEDRLVMETHLLDFTGDLYGTDVKVSFLKRRRDEMRFRDVAQLQEMIRNDKRAAEDYFRRMP